MNLKNLSVLLFMGLLTACNDSDSSSPLNHLAITFYPAAMDFNPDLPEQQVQVFPRSLESTGTSRPIDIMLQQRADGEPVEDASGNALKQNATFTVSFYSYDTFDIYTEDGEFLYTHTVYPEHHGKHYCMPISVQKDMFTEIDLPVRLPSDYAEAHDNIKACRDLHSAH
ncbi:hypothetical protein [Aliagarivorans taiwanensis]|uniref:hypothetical protein n=1 Tax=Aliagarivorans taiwanensis TaxID=561966 RepID=UPI000478E2DF|nr:hypothetical protein [Aliagarivorans taiwanensis]